MKKVVNILILCFITLSFTSIYAQEEEIPLRIGSSAESLKKEFKDLYEVEIDGSIFLVLERNEVPNVLFVFTPEDKVCNIQLLDYPLSLYPALLQEFEKSEDMVKMNSNVYAYITKEIILQYKFAPNFNSQRLYIMLTLE